MQLSTEVKTVLCKTAVAAGTSDITDATAVDTAGYEGVRFIFSFGTLTSGAVTHVAAAGLATSNPVAGTNDLLGTKIVVPDSASNTLVVLDINKPVLRYIRPHVDRGTQNAVVNCIIAELYGPSKLPVAADATVAGQELHVSPPAGTA